VYLIPPLASYILPCCTAFVCVYVYFPPQCHSVVHLGSRSVDNENFRITGAGFRFLLLDIYAQVWTLVYEYIHATAEVSLFFVRMCLHPVLHPALHLCVHSITPSLHHPLTPSLYHSLTPSLYHSLTRHTHTHGHLPLLVAVDRQSELWRDLGVSLPVGLPESWQGRWGSARVVREGGRRCVHETQRRDVALWVL
jgi:Transcription factor Tfb2